MRTAILTTVIALLLLFPTVLYAQQRGTPSVEFTKISENLYEIVGGRGSNSGAYIGDNGVLLIDSKMDKGYVDQVVRGLQKITDTPIKFLVNTHSDGDHINGNRYLPQTTTFVAHENCRKEFFGSDRNGNPSEWSEPELLPFTPAVTFRDKMDIYLGSKKVELWYFGVGHTTGDIVVYFPEEKTAFIGDQVFLTRPQLIHSYKGGDSFGHLKTLTKMLETIDAERFCSGHSEMTDRAGIQNHIVKMTGMQKKVIGLIQQGKTLEQVKAGFDEAERRLVESIYSEISARKNGSKSQQLQGSPGTNDRLIEQMKAYFGDEGGMIEHTMAVYGYACQLHEAEGGDPLIVRAGALYHDIGIPEAKRVHGSSAGKYQEIVGPPIARRILDKLEIPAEAIDRICQIIANHHTAHDEPTVGTIEFQIVWDADGLVNHAGRNLGATDEEVTERIEQLFRTTTGKKMAKRLFMQN